MKMNNLFRKIKYSSHLLILLAVLIIAATPDVSAQTFVANKDFNISIPSQNENINIFGQTTPKLPVTICNLGEESKEFNIQIISDMFPTDSKLFLLSTEKRYEPFAKTTIDAQKQQYDKILIASKKCITLYYQLTVPTYKPEEKEYFLGMPVGIKSPEQNKILTEYNITLLDKDGKPYLTLDPRISGCFENDTDIRCNDSTFSGTELNTTKNIWIYNATIDGTAAGDNGFINITVLGNGILTIYNSTLAANGANNAGGGGYNGQILLQATNISINSSLFKGYGGNGGGGGANKGGNGKLIILSDELVMNFSTFNIYGGTGDNNAGGAAGGGGDGLVTFFSTKLYILNLTISSNGGGGGTSGNGAGGYGGSSTQNFINITNLTITNLNSQSNGGDGGGGTNPVGGVGGAGTFNLNGTNILINSSIISASSGAHAGTPVTGADSNCTFISSNRLTFVTTSIKCNADEYNYIKIQAGNELTFNSSTNISAKVGGPINEYPLINITNANGKIGLFSSSITPNFTAYGKTPFFFGKRAAVFSNFTFGSNVYNVSESEYQFVPNLYTAKITSHSGDENNVIEGTIHTFYLDVYYNNSVIADISHPILYYNGTSYAGTIYANDSSYFNISFYPLTIPLMTTALLSQNVTYYWNYTATNITSTAFNLSSILKTQTQYKFLFGPCNTSLTSWLINYSFKDESTDVYMNATLDSGTNFIYWAENQNYNKTTLYTNNTENYNYSFCFYPNWIDNMTILSTLKYSSDTFSSTTYPQRTSSGTTTYLNSSVNNVLLYLLSSAKGLYVTILTQASGGAILTGTLVSVAENIGGSYVAIGQGFTDSSGGVTFWLNPNNLHSFTASKAGFETTTVYITPTQSSYTIILGGGGASSLDYDSLTEGMTWGIYPPSGLLDCLSTNQTFAFTVKYLNPNGYALQNCSLEVLNTSRDVINQTSNLTNSTLCYVQFPNYYLNQTVFGRFSVQVNGTWIVLEGDAHWICYAPNYTGVGLLDFFNQSIWLKEWGDNPETNDFSRIAFFFLMMSIILAGLNYYMGFDTQYPGTFAVYILWGAITFGTFCNGMAGPGFFYMNAVNLGGFGGTTNQVLNNMILWIFISMITASATATNIRKNEGQ